MFVAVVGSFAAGRALRSSHFTKLNAFGLLSFGFISGFILFVPSIVTLAVCYGIFCFLYVFLDVSAWGSLELPSNTNTATSPITTASAQAAQSHTSKPIQSERERTAPLLTLLWTSSYAVGGFIGGVPHKHWRSARVNAGLGWLHCNCVARALHRCFTLCYTRSCRCFSLSFCVCDCGGKLQPSCECESLSPHAHRKRIQDNRGTL